MVSCPVNDWTCPCFDSEGEGKCKLGENSPQLTCEFLSESPYDKGIFKLILGEVTHEKRPPEVFN